MKEYRTAYDKASTTNDKLDEDWENVNAMYQKLGKTPIRRIIEASKGTSDLAKQYLDAYEKASVTIDEVEKMWREADELYKKTGSNRISRIINNIKYGR